MGFFSNPAPLVPAGAEGVHAIVRSASGKWITRFGRDAETWDAMPLPDAVELGWEYSKVHPDERVHIYRIVGAFAEWSCTWKNGRRFDVERKEKARAPEKAMRAACTR